MELSKKLYNPFIRSNDSAGKVMTDVIIALLPCVLVSWFAFGYTPIILILVSIGSALITEFFFNRIFRKNNTSLDDGSAVVTGLLLAFTIGPFTPLYIVAIGAACAVLFGKLLWGGLGQNRFNPALTGREFMVVLFPAVMNSHTIWKKSEMINFESINLFNDTFWNYLLYRPIGAIGEYSPLLLILGGVFLICRRRISWHIPVAMLTIFTVMLFVFRGQHILINIGGILLGAIFMATDMPSSPSTPSGKIYFGAMIGIVAAVCLLFGANKGYFSYSILIVNAFVTQINWVFRPKTWGKSREKKMGVIQGVLLTLTIGATTAVVLWLHHSNGLIFLVIIYALYSILRFAFSEDQKPWSKLIKKRV
ncbi:MAG: RnfABCDGE type electron transport complex subunit D [Bacteroidales bacterium]|jgi:electron transport complex protein RnfD|nr:RnfABCDGE type electron transport complex subunit D [Bacteroidales bacterium]